MRNVLLPVEGLAWDLGAVELAVLCHLHRILAARRYSRDRSQVVTAEELACLRLSGPLSGDELEEGLMGLADKNAALVAPHGDVVVLTWAPWQGDAEDRQRARARRGVRRARTARPEAAARKAAAHRAVAGAIADGRLDPPCHCEACGKRCAPLGHHDDYSRPLDVRWLCGGCHATHHRQHGEAP